MANVKEIYNAFKGECKMLDNGSNCVICKIVGYNERFDSLIVATDETILRWSKFCDGDYVNSEELGGTYRYAHVENGELFSATIKSNENQKQAHAVEVEKSKQFYRRKGL